MLKKSMVALGLLLLTSLPLHAVEFTNKATTGKAEVVSFTGDQADNLSVTVYGIPSKATVVDAQDNAIRQIDINKVKIKLYFSNGQQRDTGDYYLTKLPGGTIWTVKIPYAVMRLNNAAITGYVLGYNYYDSVANVYPGSGNSCNSTQTLSYTYTDGWNAPYGIKASIFKMKVTDKGMRICY